jgi:hypothetical protein
MSWIKNHAESQKFFPFKKHEISSPTPDQKNGDESRDFVWRK